MAQLKHVQIYNSERFQHDYISSIINGKKTMDIRFLNRKSAPFSTLVSGDLVYLKESSKKIKAEFIAFDVTKIILEHSSQVEYLLKKYKTPLDITNSDEMSLIIKSYQSSKYAVIFKMQAVKKVKGIYYNSKGNRSSWITIK